MVFLVGWALLVFCQFLAGSFTSDYNGFADESGHVVTGVMVEAFLAGEDHGQPMEFASRFYGHYPKVVMGQWPPGFYALQALWNAAVGRGKVRLFLLLSALAAAVAALLYRWVRPVAGVWAAASAALLWCLAPKTLFAVTTVLAEPQLALFSVGAVLVYASYMDRGRYSAAVWFGLLAAAAFLTKSEAASLALVPPLATLSQGRWRLMLRPEFWVPAVVVGVPAGWWYAPMLQSIGTRVLVLPHTLSQFERAELWIYLLGTPLVVAAIIGWTTHFLIAALSRTLRPQFAAAGAFLVAGATFHQLVPESQEARHLVHLSPFVIGFAVIWVDSILRRFDSTALPWRRRTATALFAVVCVASSFRLGAKPETPYSRIADDLLADPALVQSAVLVSSQKYVEGPLIAELAQRRPDPEWVILRAGKQLARQDPDGQFYQPRFGSAQEVEQVMREIPVAVIVLEESPPDPLRGTHHRQLLDVVSSPTSPWKLHKRYSGDPGVLVYRLGSESLERREAVKIEIGRIGRIVEIPAPSSP